MSMTSDLRIYEKAMLLILKDKEGTVAVSMYTHGLAGSILMELFLEQRLELEGKHRVIKVSDTTPLADPLLDECLTLIKNSSEERRALHWISTIASLAKLKDRIAGQLCQKGILREDKGKVLFFFTRKIYPELDPKPEADLVEELRQAIFTDCSSVSAHTAALVAVGNGTGLLVGTFKRKDLKLRKERIDAIVNGDLADAVSAIAQAVQELALFIFL